MQILDRNVIFPHAGPMMCNKTKTQSQLSSRVNQPDREALVSLSISSSTQPVGDNLEIAAACHIRLAPSVSGCSIRVSAPTPALPANCSRFAYIYIENTRTHALVGTESALACTARMCMREFAFTNARECVHLQVRK
jgi:hypothetical protein